MQRFAFQRRRGHRETPILVGMVWLFCTFGMGLATLARDVKRAEKVGAVLDASEKWLAFAYGCLNGTAAFFILLIAICVIAAVSSWLENWRWKRQQAKRKNKP